MSFEELLRTIHVAAYASPGVCTGEDEIAMYTFNITGLHRSQPPATINDLTYSIVGLFPDGSASIHPDDASLVLPDGVTAREESIRCIRSASRGDGATHFAIVIHSAEVLRD